MADLSHVTLPDGSIYYLKDSKAREDISKLFERLERLEASIENKTASDS